MSRLHVDVMQVLIGDIVHGTFQEGDLLPREADIATKYGVSRGVARECIRGLEERGLIAVKHGRGATVLPERDWDTLDPFVLTGLLQGERRLETLRDYLEARRLLEVEAAAIAAERATDEDLEELGKAYELMRESAEVARTNPAAEGRYHEADIAFHRAVVNATENLALGRITEPLHRALLAVLGPLSRPENRFDVGLPEHERILKAIQSRKPAKARAAMAAHLETVEGYLPDAAPDRRKSARVSV
jgi:GntR family transcriptional repressor for pyruvate dehydrogenase complex